jgi:hypothetical protein
MLKSTLGQLCLTSRQAEKLGVCAYSQISPHLENCCLRLSAVVSYERASQEVAYLTGINVSAKTQQRLVQRHPFDEPQAEVPIAELAVDGGTIRLRTPLGEPCEWRHYKAIAMDQNMIADFRNNQALMEQVNHYCLANPVTCLGDGHDGIWNLIADIATPEQRREILDWYHLKENLYKIPLSRKRLEKVEAYLWQGDVEATLVLLENTRQPQAQNFCAYVRKHQARIVNYDYYQAEGICSIGSGQVESAIKQINRRVQITGAQWDAGNVSQVLAHRCAYLNGLIGDQSLVPNEYHYSSPN